MLGAFATPPFISCLTVTRQHRVQHFLCCC
jgi:hypothetical protein